MEKSLFPRGCDSARVIPVIETRSARGSGEAELTRTVSEYWTLDGEKIAEYDPIVELPVDLSEIRTRDLVAELRKREGVDTKIAEPNEDVTVSVNGPAIVLVVID